MGRSEKWKICQWNITKSIWTSNGMMLISYSMCFSFMRLLLNWEIQCRIFFKQSKNVLFIWYRFGHNDQWHIFALNENRLRIHFSQRRQSLQNVFIYLYDNFCGRRFAYWSIIWQLELHIRQTLECSIRFTKRNWMFLFISLQYGTNSSMQAISRFCLLNLFLYFCISVDFWTIFMQLVFRIN